MDILSFIHIAIELGMKALKAPTDYQKVLESILERYDNQQSLSVNLTGITKGDINKEMQVAGSPAQKAWNNFVYNVQISMIAFNQMQIELREIYDKIALREKRAAFMQTLDDERARVAQFWEAIDIDVEFNRLLKLQEDYFKDSQSLLTNIQTLSVRLQHIDVQIMQEIKKIQEISHERINMAENIIQESTQKDIESFSAIHNELDKVVSKYDNDLNEIRRKLQQSTLPPQARDELISQEARAVASKTHVEQFTVKISDLKEKSTQFFETNQKVLHDLRTQIAEATEPDVHQKLSQQLTDHIVVSAGEKMVLEKEKHDLLKQLSGLDLIHDTSIKSLIESVEKNNIAQQLKDIVSHRGTEENQSYDNLSSLLTTRKDIQKEIEENLQLHHNLEGKMRQNDMHIRGSHRKLEAKHQQQLNNVTIQPKI